MNPESRRSIALVTYAKLPALSADDQVLRQLLTDAGHSVAAVQWDSANEPWEEYDAVIVRSAWDYYHRLDQFLAWLDRLERSGARVFNSVTTLRWNVNKDYLRQLGAAGIIVPPTAWLPRGESVSLRALLAENDWQQVVVKPTVSATAFETFRVGPDVTDAEETRFAALLPQRDLMVQPYLKAIADQGEFSLLFFGGVFSHAVLKRPRQGDFRVQSDFGGSVVTVTPTAALIASAAAVLAVAPGPTLYARVDGCLVDDRFVLMELELVEPCLFFLQDSRAAGRFVAALLGQIFRASSTSHAEDDGCSGDAAQLRRRRATTSPGRSA